MNSSDPRREVLFNLLASPYGLAYTIVDKYYQDYHSADSIPLFDPVEKVRYCRCNLSYLSLYCRYLRQIRNILVHCRCLPFDLLNRFISEVEKLSRREENRKALFAELHQKIISCLGASESSGVGTRDSISEDSEASSESSEQLEEISVKELKEKYRDKIKYKKITLLEGKYKGEEVIFKSWNGTSTYVKTLDGRELKYSTRGKVLVNMKDLR